MGAVRMFLCGSVQGSSCCCREQTFKPFKHYKQQNLNKKILHKAQQDRLVKANPFVSAVRGEIIFPRHNMFQLHVFDT